MDQVVQVAGAMLILAAYAAAQFGWLDQTSRAYLTLNLVGAAVLGWLAWDGRQWGFLLLEVAWTLISAWGLYQTLSGREPTRAGH